VATGRVEPAEVDGRTARRDRNRDAVLDAVLELFSEDCLAPAAQDVAERSGVSLRSVYRYYEDMDELVRQAIARNVERSAPLFEVPGPDDGPVGERVERFVAARLSLYEAVAPTMRAALLRARTSDPVRQQIEAARRRLLDQVRHSFGPELGALAPSARREVASALDVLLGFESAEHLRRHRGMSGPETRRTLVRAVAALLAAPG
jgi:AcrR family transcriptional regulator